MTTLVICVSALVACTIAEVAVPGNGLYHQGWLNVLLVALIVAAFVALPKTLRNQTSSRGRAATIAFTIAGAVAGFATVASGLLGPDTQTIVAAPGASVRIDALGGSLVFPIVEAGADVRSSVLLARGTQTVTIAPSRFTGPFLLRATPRDVVFVDVFDARGAHLTVTQPTGSTFLSPVLLMQSQQTIAGMSLPYDTFAVPAAHRLVKTVLFGPEQAARLPALAGAQHAVLFDVENENEVSLKNGIGVARDGQRVALADIVLQPRVFSYPAVTIVSVPDIRIALAAAVLACIALGLTIAARTV